MNLERGGEVRGVANEKGAVEEEDELVAGSVAVVGVGEDARSDREDIDKMSLGEEDLHMASISIGLHPVVTTNRTKT